MTPEPSKRQVHPTAATFGPAETADVGAGRFQIAVVGAGYVGLTTAACLSHLGHRVTAVDVDVAKVERMRRGESPLFEAGLTELIEEGLATGRLSFTTEASEAAAEADFVFLCVPTPQGADGAADLRYLKQAANQIAPHLRPGAVVVTVYGSSRLCRCSRGRLGSPRHDRSVEP